MRMRLVTALVCIAAPAISARAQNFGIEYVAGWNGDPGTYADVWGQGDLAFLGKYGYPRVILFDVSNPAAPVHLATYNVPPPNERASAQDVKTAGGLMFVALEANGRDGAEIVDIRDPRNPRRLLGISVFPHVHNLFYADGWLYLADSRTTRFAVIDLRGFDPDDPPPPITTATWMVEGVGATFVHDVTVQGARAYVSAWDSIQVFDVSDVASAAPRYMGSAPGQSTHSAWATDDGRFLVTAEERTGGGIKLYEVEDNGVSATLTLRDEFAVAGQTVHNPLILGERVYCSWYGLGCQIFRIDRQAMRFVRVGSYATGRAWGAYPFLGPHRILIGDMTNGLVILRHDIRGDLNCDGHINNFDIDPFILALLDPGGYAASFAHCRLANADINGDGFVNNFDIDPFVGLLVQP